jgi:hypothetical protein
MPKIKFLPANGQILNIAPIPEPMSKNIPEWWKKQPSFLNNNQNLINGSYQYTVKKCQAVFDNISAGYVLKCPIDIYIRRNGDSFSIEVPNSWNELQGWIISGHPRDQISHMPIDKEIYYEDILRIHPLWCVETPKGYSTMFKSLILGDESPILAVPAIVDTDEFPSDGHLSFFLKKNFEGVIKQGTPLIQVIPFKREEWEHSVEEFDKGYIHNKRLKVRSTFANGYRMKFWSKKEYK